MWWWRSMSLSQYYGAIASVLSRLNKDWSSHLLVFYHHMFFISWSQLGGLNYLSPILNTFLYNLFCYQESSIYVDFIGYKGFGKRFKVQTGNLSKWNNKKISQKRDRERYIQNVSTTFFPGYVYRQNMGLLLENNILEWPAHASHKYVVDLT